MLNYYANFVIIPISFLLYIFITVFTGLAKDEIPTDEEVLSWLIIQSGHTTIWLVPALSLTLHILRLGIGSSAPLTYITRLPNLSLLVHFGSALIMWSQTIYYV